MRPNQYICRVSVKCTLSCFTLPSQLFDIGLEYDFEVIGLTCQDKDFRLVWAINMEMGWSMERDVDHKVTYKTHSTLHSRFVFKDEQEGRTMRLLVNKGEGGVLLPELQGIDFVLLLEGFGKNEILELSGRLRRIAFVQASLVLDLNKIKSKYNLLTD